MPSQGPSLKEWLEATAAPDPEVRLRAVTAALDRSGTGRRVRRSKSAARRMVALLGDDSLRVRAAVAILLWKLPGDAALPGLQDLMGSEHWRVRCLAARAIGIQGGVSALQALRAGLRREAEPEALPWYAEALGQTGEAGALPDLLELSGNADWRVRWGAAQGLEHLRHRAALELVEQLASDPEVPEEKQAALTKWRRDLRRRFRPTD